MTGSVLCFLSSPSGAHLSREIPDRGQSAGPDPFCGTGTTLVECKKLGVASVGIEANPVAHFASQVNLTGPPIRALSYTRPALPNRRGMASPVTELRTDPFEANNLFSPPRRDLLGTLRGLSVEKMKLLLAHSISPLPLHKTLLLLEFLEGANEALFTATKHSPWRRPLFFRLAIFTLDRGRRWEGEEGRPRCYTWMNEIRNMAADLKSLHSLNGTPSRFTMEIPAESHRWSNRNPSTLLSPRPHTRMRRIIHGQPGWSPFCWVLSRTSMRSRSQKRARQIEYQECLQGGHDDLWVADNKRIQNIAHDIEGRRIQMGKTSGFERMYHRVAKLYFGGMARHLRLRSVLKPGARLAYVVGDQASYLRVMIRTGNFLRRLRNRLDTKCWGSTSFGPVFRQLRRVSSRRSGSTTLAWPGPLRQLRVRLIALELLRGDCHYLRRHLVIELNEHEESAGL